MSDREKNGSSSSLPNQDDSFQPENESGTSDNADEDYADEIFRGASGVDDTTSFDDMPPPENHHGPIVIIPPVPRDLNVQDQWRFIFYHYSRPRAFLRPKDYDMEEAKKRFDKK